ncbi:MAG: sensor domain-containing diguanylate cyclase [Proteobacteria bacterium]|nr:sensor domain-containing diguanylate cyclase [Pseudomonadota bacterium]MBU1685878.1 sensor domain-containing diguanylate cyclase [Pseudomonadota bacterium]
MKKLSNRGILRLIVSTSFLIALVLAAFSLLIVTPSFTKMVEKNTEQEAVRVARHLMEMLETNATLTNESIKTTTAFQHMATKVVNDLDVVKIKLFSSFGETIYSTSSLDIGKLNEHDYFQDVVAQGKILTKHVKKENKSLEGQVYSVDVVETYVPIMVEGQFLGAFEIYLDITKEVEDLGSLLFMLNGVMLTIASCLILAMLFISWRALLNFIAQEHAEEMILAQGRELATKNSELSVINTISQTLSSSIDLDNLLPKILQTVIDRLAVLRLARKGGIFLLNGDRLELATHIGHPEEFLSLHENLTINDCLCGLAARTGEVVYSANSHEDEHHTICYPGMDPHGHIIIPLLSGKKVVGVLYLYLPAGIEVDRSNRELLKSIGNQIGMAVDNARLYEETKHLALHDPLTGLSNRRSMETNLQKTIGMAERYQQPLTVAMLDIDYFKKYNDTHGHAAGDKLLVKVAKAITNSTRITDHPPARYGGEEFLILLPATELEGAMIPMERLRQTIEEELEITISIGLAQYRRGSNRDELVKAADSALYRAKENGRNRVECFHADE